MDKIRIQSKITVRFPSLLCNLIIPEPSFRKGEGEIGTVGYFQNEAEDKSGHLGIFHFFGTV